MPGRLIRGGPGPVAGVLAGAPVHAVLGQVRQGEGNGELSVISDLLPLFAALIL